MWITTNILYSLKDLLQVLYIMNVCSTDIGYLFKSDSYIYIYIY